MIGSMTAVDNRVPVQPTLNVNVCPMLLCLTHDRCRL